MMYSWIVTLGFCIWFCLIYRYWKQYRNRETPMLIVLSKWLYNVSICDNNFCPKSIFEYVSVTTFFHGKCIATFDITLENYPNVDTCSGIIVGSTWQNGDTARHRDVKLCFSCVFPIVKDCHIFLSLMQGLIFCGTFFISTVRYFCFCSCFQRQCIDQILSLTFVIRDII